VTCVVTGEAGASDLALGLSARPPDAPEWLPMPKHYGRDLVGETLFTDSSLNGL
jgi:hypothetical protein